MTQPCKEDTLARTDGFLPPGEKSPSETPSGRRGLSTPCRRDPTSSGDERFRRLVEHLPAPAACVQGESILYNQAASDLIGHPRGDLPTLASWFETLYRDRASQVRGRYESDRQAGFPQPRIVPLIRKDGEERLVEFAAHGEDAGEVWLLRDVTESERLARMLEQTARAAHVGGWEVDARTHRLFWTLETYRIHELSPADYSPTVESAITFYAPESIPLITEAVERGLTEGEPFDLELELITARGRRIWVRAIGVAEWQEGGNFKLFGSFQDITTRRLADEALRRSEEQKRRLLASSPDCLLELDMDGMIQFVNPRGMELLELEDPTPLLGRSWLDLWPDRHQPEFRTALDQARRGQDVRLQASGATCKGSPRWWDVQLTAIRDPIGRAHRLLVSARDLTDWKMAEEEREAFRHNLLQTQKLESLGVLAGGIAHDFNNLLTGILGNADLARFFTPASSPTLTYLEQIERAAERAADLCRQMLAYAGKGRFVVGPVDLGGVVNETAQLLQVSVSKKATLTLCLGAGLPPIQADATQIRQILMNLVINASEALGDNEGLIAVSTGKQQVERGLPGLLDPGSCWSDQEYVYLEVADTGTGMPGETLARIFEPFFTTKFTGRGLGLSAVLGIVRSHRGLLKVGSKPGQGSSFRLYFPAAPSVAPEEVTPVKPTSWQGQGTILVVDDEEPVRKVAGDLIRSFGFDVVPCEDGWAAIQTMKHHGERIQLVLLDLTMPRLDGVQTLEQLQSITPGVRVVLMSGYSEREVSERFVGKKLAGFLQKPFSREQMGQKLREALV